MAGEDPAGGSFQLAELIDQYGEHIYRDLHEYAGGLNLIQALDDGSDYSPRQLLVLIKGLPLESATVAAMRGGPEFRGWDMNMYRLTEIVDAVQYNTYAIIQSNAGKKKVTPPAPIPRPDTAAKKRATGKPNPFAQRLAAAKRAKGVT